MQRAFQHERHMGETAPCGGHLSKLKVNQSRMEMQAIGESQRSDSAGQELFWPVLFVQGESPPPP